MEALLGVGLLGLSAVGVALSAEADSRCQTAAAQAAELERGAEQAVERIRAVCTAPGVMLLAPDPRGSRESSSSLAIVRCADPSQSEVSIERIELRAAAGGAPNVRVAVWVRSGAADAVELGSPVGGGASADGGPRSRRAAAPADDEPGLRFVWSADHVACRISLRATDVLGRTVVRSAETLIPLPRVQG